VDIKLIKCVETVSRHFGPIRLVPKCPDSRHQCLVDTSALVPNCLNIQQTLFATTGHTKEKFNITRYYY